MEKDEVRKWEFRAQGEGATGAFPKDGVDVEDPIIDTIATQ